MSIGSINNYDGSSEINRQQELDVINQVPGQDQSAIKEEVERKMKEVLDQINSAPNLEELAKLQDQITAIKELMDKNGLS